MSKTPQPPGSKIGWDPRRVPDRTQATPAQQPQANQGRAESRTVADTYFTKAGSSQILYNGDRQWAKVTLLLETAGPVSVGNQAEITPVNSGKGQLLRTGVPAVFTVAKGTRLFVASTGINRISRLVEPVPWLEQITALVSNVIGAVAGIGKRGQ